MGIPLRSRLRNSTAPSFGTWVSSASLVSVDALRGLAFDWFMIDTEHAHVNPETLAAMLALLGERGPTPLVRVGAADQYLVKQALDAGAEGVLAPLVNSAEQARSVASFAKYPPDGVRGVAASAASRYGLELPTYVRDANARTLVGVQIESREALGCLDKIAAVDAVDVLFVGPQDLTLNLGLGTERDHPQVRDAMRQVVAACERHGKVPGTLAVTVAEKRAAVKLGFRFVSLASDVRFLLHGARQFLDG